MFNKLNSIGHRLHPEMRQIVHNVSLLFAERILTLVVNFAVGVYVIRYLGSEQFGMLSYCVSFVGLFSAIAPLGLKAIVVRDIVRDEAATPEILGTVMLLRLIGAILAIILIVIITQSWQPEPKLQALILILALQIMLVAIDNTYELWFESQVLTGKAGAAKIAQLVFASFSRIGLVWFKLPLVAFAWTYIAMSLVKVLSISRIYRHHARHLRSWQINWGRGRQMLKDSWPLIFSAIAITLYMRIDQVMLGSIAGPSAVGNYAAAVKFSEVWYFVPMAICSSVFPAIIRAKRQSHRLYYRKLQQLFDVMVWISLTLAIVMSFCAESLIELVLGSGYESAGAILALHIWSGIFAFLSVARSKWLIEENFTRFSSVSTSCGALSNILLNLILIPSYGGIGAAIATLISYGISAYFSCLIYPPTAKTVGWMLTKALLVPLRWQQNLLYLRRLQKYFA